MLKYKSIHKGHKSLLYLYLGWKGMPSTEDIFKMGNRLAC
jgi:hypothetical protein